jgi:cyclic-di-GMP-binding protein
MLTQPSSGPTYYARLQFADATSCVGWLESIPLDRPAQAHEMVSAQIGLVGRAELPALERLRILEMLYQSAGHLQERLARFYIGRALPLSIVEYSIWSTVVELWQTLFNAYQPALRRAFKGERGLGAHAPLLALRCVEFTAAAIKEHHRVYRDVPATLWKQLHEAYAFAERHGVVAVGIADPLAPAIAARTAAAAYARTLLAHLSNPYTMSPRQMSVMYRWAQLWEGLVGIGPNPVAPGLSAVVAVDLRAAEPAVPARRVEGGASIRYISMEQLGQALRRVLTALRQGHDPASLGLGEDCRQPGCERLLTLLYVQWCGSGMGQLAPRERGEDARAAVGFRGACRQLALESEAFRSGTVAISTAAGPFTEQWYVAATHAPGFIAVARGPECDARIEHHQLVAIRRRSASSFQLAVAQWMKLEEDGDLSIGLRVLPGIPHATPFQLDRARAADDGQPMAILLPAAPETRTPASLVLAPEIFKPGRELELLSGTLRRIKLVRLLERGVDFERAVFEIVA